jgi:eukaryotic-like serine/threonine-protein kinase
VRLGRLRAWTTVFSVELDPALVKNAADSAAARDDLAVCDDPSSGPLPPRDPIVAAQARSLDEQIVSASTRAKFGTYPPAYATLQRLVAASRALGIQSAVETALAAQAAAEGRVGELKTALATWSEVRDLAEESRDDAHRLQAWVQIVFVQGSLSRFEEGHEAARVATAILKPMSGYIADELHARLLYNKGMLAWSEKKRDEALDYMLRAEKEFRRIGLSDVMVLAQGDFAGLLGELGRSGDAEVIDVMLLAYLLAVEGQAHPTVAVVLNNLGNLRFYRRDWQGALDSYRQALEVKERSGLGPNSTSRAFGLLNSGGALMHLGRFDEAIDVLTEGRRILVANIGNKNAYLPDLDTYLGMALIGRGLAEQAAPHLEAALAQRLAESSDPGDLAETRFALARALSAHGDQQRARKLAGEAEVGFAAAGPRWTVEHDETARWLATRR